MLKFHLFLLAISLPAQAAIQQETANIDGNGTALAYAADVSDNDLANAGQATLSNFSSTDSFDPGGASFQTENLNDGDYLAPSGDVTYFDSGHLPATVVFDLNTTLSPLGYDISSIGTFMGWSGVNGTQCNQVYTVEVSFVGSASYTQIASVEFRPYGDTGLSTPYESKVILTDDTEAILATGVDSVRFVFSSATGASRGTVIREIDVNGTQTGSSSGLVAATLPVERQIFQRDDLDQANIPISGTYADTVDSIEARLVVRSEAGNSGTSTSWQTIDAAPSGNTYSGTLANVPAGGWYDLELRSLTGGEASAITRVQRIGVGDIYLIAGQSNAANFGSPVLDPLDDRLSSRTLPTGNEWVRTTDPLPSLEEDPGNPRSGTGGSPWTRLGPLLTASEDVPVGFLSMGIGSTHVNEWTSPNLFYLSRLKDAIQSFPANGFKAILWHQGERDANDGNSYSDYKTRIESIIAQTRIDAGWNIPWYLAEASFQGASNLSTEEPIKAAQRAAAFADPLVFLGPSTDEFHLENANGGKLIDNVHFNGAGLADHASQWFAILQEEIPTALENSDFEKNVDPVFTTSSALPENGISLTDITAGNSPSIIDWRILSSNGQAAADGSNGFFNPGSATYGGSNPAGLSGPHAAFLSEGSAGNNMVQMTRSRAIEGEIYELSAAIGLRNTGTGIFGDCRLEILAGNTTIQSLDVTSADLVAGEFTGKKISVTAAAAQAGEELGVRITKINGGANTYLDVDNVRLSLFSPTTGIVTASEPTPRQIVQRSPANLGDIPLSGIYEGSVDTIEARAVVRPEAGNSGITTEWQTIDNAPGGNIFTGSLTGVPAGGWYDIEFRSVTLGNPSAVTSIERVGVGDIYLLAGQSNAGGFGDPPLDPNDDRFSARTLPTGNSWVRGADPLPNYDPSRGGTGGSAWSRLGPLLTTAEDVPIGVLSLAIGNTFVDEWTSPKLFYQTRLKAAVQSFPPNGFKAILWHQGERDANKITPFADYQSQLEAAIAQTRIDAGWTIPWYVSEASYQPSADHVREQPIKAAQRAVVANDPLVFLGSTTDEFHLENAGAGKTNDGIHYNSIGLAEHAAQWAAILTGNPPVGALNGDFEKNISATTSSTLPEDGVELSLITDLKSPAVLHWRTIAANGSSAADGSNGYFNPGPATYGTTSPSGLNGPHAAFLSEGTAGNFLIQPTRHRVVANQRYQVVVALGLRSAGPGIYGNARLELLSGSTVIGSTDILSGQLVSGAFTDVSLAADSTPAHTDEELAIRITKLDGGANTYLDFDNVRLFSNPLTPFGIWASGYNLSDPAGNADGDQLANLLEFALDTNPNSGNHPYTVFTPMGDHLRITRRIAGPANLVYTLQSTDTLVPANWTDVDDVITTPVSTNGPMETVDLSITGGWAINPDRFFRLAVELAP